MVKSSGCSNGRAIDEGLGIRVFTWSYGHTVRLIHQQTTEREREVGICMYMYEMVIY